MNSLKHSQYKYEDEVRKEALKFIKILLMNDIIANFVPDSFRDYCVKISISKFGKIYGNAILYFKPSKKSYSLVLNEITDKSIIPEIENIWHNGIKTKNSESQKGYHIYVDGSYINNSSGYGFVILKDGVVHKKFHGIVEDTLAENTRNIAGEIRAVEQAVKWCQRNSVKEVTIFHDYDGLEKWVTGKWKAKLPLTQNYTASIRNCGVKIRWEKITSHSGNRWNEVADKLAKKSIILLN